MRALNAPMFHSLDIVVTIGRDTKKLLLHYGGMTSDKSRIDPNWATLARGFRAIAPDNPLSLSLPLHSRSDYPAISALPTIPSSYSRTRGGCATTGTFTSCCRAGGGGFDQLIALQSEARLPNVTLVDRVADEQLETFLSAADVWIIPYRKNVAGVSVPSRFYNLLAIGRPVTGESDRPRRR